MNKLIISSFFLFAISVHLNCCFAQQEKYALRLFSDARRADLEFEDCDIAFSPDGKLVATASRWQASLPPADVPNDNLFLLRGRIDSLVGSIKVWDVESGRQSVKFDNFIDVEFVSNGILAGLSSQGNVAFIDISTGQVRNLTETGDVKELMISPDGKRLAAVRPGNFEQGGVIYILDTGSGRVLGQVEHFPGYRSSAIAFSNSSFDLVTAEMDRETRMQMSYFWAIGNGRPGNGPPKRPGEKTGSNRIQGHNQPVTSMAIGNAGHWASATLGMEGEYAGEIILHPNDNIAPKTLQSNLRVINDLAFSKDGKTLAAAGGGRQRGMITLWDVATARPKTNLEGHTKPVVSVVFSPDGRTIATASLDQTVKIWQTPQVPRQLILNITDKAGNPINNAEISINGKKPESGLVGPGRYVVAVMLGDCDIEVGNKEFLPGAKTIVVRDENEPVLFSLERVVNPMSSYEAQIERLQQRVDFIDLELQTVIDKSNRPGDYQLKLTVKDDSDNVVLIDGADISIEQVSLDELLTLQKDLVGVRTMEKQLRSEFVNDAVASKRPDANQTLAKLTEIESEMAMLDSKLQAQSMQPLDAKAKDAGQGVVTFDLNPGEYKVTLAKKDYATKTADIGVREKVTEFPIELKKMIAPPPEMVKLQIFIKDADRKILVGGATVSVRDKKIAAEEATIAELRQEYLDLRAQIEDSSYEKLSDSEQQELAARAKMANHEFEERMANFVKLGQSFVEAKLHTSSDPEKGIFVFDVVPGDYEVAVSKQDYEIGRMDVSAVERRTPYDVLISKMVIPTYAVSIQVFGNGADPIGGLEVVAEPGVVADREPGDAKDQFRLKPGEYEVMAEVDGLTYKPQIIAIESENAPVMMKPVVKELTTDEKIAILTNDLDFDGKGGVTSADFTPRSWEFFKQRIGKSDNGPVRTDEIRRLVESTIKKSDDTVNAADTGNNAIELDPDKATAIMLNELDTDKSGDITVKDFTPRSWEFFKQRMGNINATKFGSTELKVVVEQNIREMKAKNTSEPKTVERELTIDERVKQMYDDLNTDRKRPINKLDFTNRSWEQARQLFGVAADGQITEVEIRRLIEGAPPAKVVDNSVKGKLIIRAKDNRTF